MCSICGANLQVLDFWEWRGIDFNCGRIGGKKSRGSELICGLGKGFDPSGRWTESAIMDNRRAYWGYKKQIPRAMGRVIGPAAEPLRRDMRTRH